MNWKLKRFNELEIEEIYKILMIRNRVFIVEQKCVYQDCDNKDKNSYHLYLEDNSHIVAYLRILKKGISYEQVSIGRLLVNKKYRHKGIAREMITKAINFIEQDLMQTQIRISAQLYLINFYKSIGFKEMSQPYLEDGISHIEMIYNS